MEAIKVANEMRRVIGCIRKKREELTTLADDRATAYGTYEKELAKTLIQLKNGVPMQLGDELIENPPASTAERIARGICYKEKIEMEKTDALYKNGMAELKAMLGELNAMQSIFRYLEEA